MSTTLESLSAQIARLAAELKEVEQRLGSEPPPETALLNDFRNTVDTVRLKAWSVAELTNARYAKEDPNAVFSFSTAERVRRFDQLVLNLCGDLDTGLITFQTNGMHSLSRSIDALSQRMRSGQQQQSQKSASVG